MADNKILCTLGQCEPEMLSAADIMWPEGESLANLDPSLRILCTLSELYDRELVAAIGWAKQIPGNMARISFVSTLVAVHFRRLQVSWRCRSTTRCACCRQVGPKCWPFRWRSAPSQWTAPIPNCSGRPISAWTRRKPASAAWKSSFSRSLLFNHHMKIFPSLSSLFIILVVFYIITTVTIHCIIMTACHLKELNTTHFKC